MDRINTLNVIKDKFNFLVSVLTRKIEENDEAILEYSDVSKLIEAKDNEIKAAENEVNTGCKIAMNSIIIYVLFAAVWITFKLPIPFAISVAVLPVVCNLRVIPMVLKKIKKEHELCQMESVLDKLYDEVSEGGKIIDDLSADIEKMYNEYKVYLSDIDVYDPTLDYEYFCLEKNEEDECTDSLDNEEVEQFLKR